MTTIHGTHAPTGARPRRAYTPEHRRLRPAARLPRPVAAAVPIAALGAAVLLPSIAPQPSGRSALPLHALDIDATTGPSATTPGAVVAFGSAPALGGPGAGLVAPVVGIARTHSGNGYWLAAADGGVFSYGDAGYHGSLGATPLTGAIVGMAATADGGGYWLVAADGGVFSFGDAPYLGSLGGLALAQPIVGMAATPGGSGYWLVAADGGVFSFGDATYHGSTGGVHLTSPVVGIAGTADGAGYWLAAADGGIFSFGDAGYHGSLGGAPLAKPITAIAASPTGAGYWLLGSDGGLFTFGDASFDGSLAPEPSGTSVVAIASGADDRSYWAVTAPTPPPKVVVPPPAAPPPVIPLGDFEVTCYDNYGETASGATTSLATVSVDPAVIRLGTTITIAGVGTRIAQDTGSAVRGAHVDIWEPSASECAAWGVQTRAVYRSG